MSALLVSEVSTRRDYWRNTAVTPTEIQSSWRRIFVDRSYHIGPFLVGWSATFTLGLLPACPSSCRPREPVANGLFPWAGPLHQAIGRLAKKGSDQIQKWLP